MVKNKFCANTILLLFWLSIARLGEYIWNDGEIYLIFVRENVKRIKMYLIYICCFKAMLDTQRIISLVFLVIQVFPSPRDWNYKLLKQ